MVILKPAAIGVVLVAAALINTASAQENQTTRDLVAAKTCWLAGYHISTNAGYGFGSCWFGRKDGSMPAPDDISNVVRQCVQDDAKIEKIKLGKSSGFATMALSQVACPTR